VCDGGAVGLRVVQAITRVALSLCHGGCCCCCSAVYGVVSPGREGECPCGLFKQGAAENKIKENNQCTYVLYLARIKLLYTYDDVIFLSRF
jgi:hypothetical protein